MKRRETPVRAIHIIRKEGSPNGTPGFRITATRAMRTERFRNRKLRGKVAALPIDTLSATDRGADLDPKRPLDSFSDQFYLNAWCCGNPSDSKARGRQHHRRCASLAPGTRVRRRQADRFAQPPSEMSLFPNFGTMPTRPAAQNCAPIYKFPSGWHWQPQSTRRTDSQRRDDGALSKRVSNR